ncbi:MAG: hypothetical protein FJ161_04925, partial [Gammaproteobacteria bacterium]|nr:hypothetical protein [Gammaproteobacteria bacterium]
MSRSIFLKDTDVRWCPGCGDYAILKYLAETLEARGLKPEDVTVVSGIGCSSRLPYYLNTYGFHTLHGRALSIATGIALVQPDRPLIVITGDGDSCSIGLNHYLHTIKRNVNMTIILVNNHVYGLTKGQHSPTSLVGQKTKTMPQGVQEEPFSPLLLALAAGGSWLGRCFDVDHKLMKSLLNHALNHKGTSVLEVIQNCPIFDQDAYLSLKEHYRESYILWPNQKEEEDWNNGRYLYKDSSSQE